jgi:hypothetical protein
MSTNPDNLPRQLYFVRVVVRRVVVVGSVSVHDVKAYEN